jgi:hypothetical protein
MEFFFSNYKLYDKYTYYNIFRAIKNKKINFNNNKNIIKYKNNKKENKKNKDNKSKNKNTKN